MSFMSVRIFIYIYGRSGGGDQDSKKCWAREEDGNGSELPSTDGDVLGQTSANDVILPDLMNIFKAASNPFAFIYQQTRNPYPCTVAA